MRERKFEKSHIHILESETLSRESRVTDYAQEIVDSIPYIYELYTYVPLRQVFCFIVGRMFYKNWGFYLEGV